MPTSPESRLEHQDGLPQADEAVNPHLDPLFLEGNLVYLDERLNFSRRISKQAVAVELGLSPDASLNDIGVARADLGRVWMARQLGLSDEASWDEITLAEDRYERTIIGQALGESEGEVLEWRHLFKEVLGLPRHASLKSMVKRV